MIHFWDGFAAVSMAILLIVGGYQFYFLPQRYPIRRPISLLSRYDEIIPFRPRWVWIYSLLYYPFIISVVATLDDFRHYSYTAFSFISLLISQIMIAYILPVKTPHDWRDFNSENSASEKFLAFVHSYDAGGNCFPSMHVGVSSLTTMHLLTNLGKEWPTTSGIVVLCMALILISTVFTKQHYLIDLPAGFALAGLNFWLFLKIY